MGLYPNACDLQCVQPLAILSIFDVALKPLSHCLCCLAEEIAMSDSEQVERGGGYSVADLAKTKSLSRQVNKTKQGSTLKRADAAWSVQKSGRGLQHGQFKREGAGLAAWSVQERGGGALSTVHSAWSVQERGRGMVNSRERGRGFVNSAAWSVQLREGAGLCQQCRMVSLREGVGVYSSYYIDMQL